MTPIIFDGFYALCPYDTNLKVEEICENRVHNLVSMDITFLHCDAMLFAIERRIIQILQCYILSEFIVNKYSQ